MKIKLKQAIELAGFIERGLAGRPKALRVNNQDTVIVEPFSLANDAPILLAINLNRLKVHVDEYNAAYQAAFKSLSDNDGEIKQGTANMVTFLDQDAALKDRDVDVKLHKVQLSDLKPTDNKFSPGEIAALMPILKFDVAAEAA